MTILDRSNEQKFIDFYEISDFVEINLLKDRLLTLHLSKEHLTNFNSNMALIVLISASIYQKFTHYFNPN